MEVGNVGSVEGSGKTTEPMTAEDDLKFLRSGEKSEEKETTEEEAPEEVDDESDDAETEDEESDEESAEESEEDEEETTDEPLGSLVTAKDLKAKYPDIFKKVPELRNVIYREQQYSTIFSDPKEAQVAANQAETLRDLESDLYSGNSKNLLEVIKNDKKADFNKLVSNLLPTLKELDEPTFMKVIAVPLKQVLRAAFANGVSKKNKNLELSAQHIHDFIFDGYDLDSKADFEVETKEKNNPEEERLKKKLDELDQRDHNNFKKSVDSECIDEIKKIFFDRFDPDGLFTQWIKDKMFDDALGQLDKQLLADPRHMKSTEVLWRAAKAAGYNSESKSRIVNTVLARAKQIIPQIRQNIRSAALAKERKEGKKTLKVVKREGTIKREAKPSTKDTSKMSDLDIIRSA